MGWLDRLKGETVALDTAPLIYFMEEHPRYLPVVRPFFEALDRGEMEALTSAVTLLEVLVQPLRSQDDLLCRKYRDILTHARHSLSSNCPLPSLEEPRNFEPRPVSGRPTRFSWPQR